MDIRIKVPVLLSAVVLLTASCSPQKPVSGNYEVVPLPKQIAIKQGNPFLLTGKTTIVYPSGDSALSHNARLLSGYIEEATGFCLPVKEENDASGKLIRLLTDKQIKEKEGYRLVVTENAVEVAGSTPAGIFYGMQTLRKSLPVCDRIPIELPAATVNDHPRFAYRGMMLDVGRHFFTVDSMKRFIDMLALHNVNTMHWHLTDDQGWRIEIKKYPRLTEVGSIRKETVIGRNTNEYDGKPYGGFYTQDEIRDVIAYAAERYITIIPEIDLPGHMSAALASYPELGCTGGPYEVGTRWGVKDDVLCAGNNQTLSFVEDVLAEVIDLFPSEYIHVGGDECPKVRWEKCPKCQARIKAEGLKADNKHTAENRLQSYVMTRIERFVNSKGRQIIGWDEIQEGGLAPQATVMSWRGMGGGIEVARQKHPVIMSPNGFVYFDFYQTDRVEEEPLANGGYLPIEKVYSFEPVPADQLTAEEQKYIIGAQANLWSEYMTTYKQVEYMTLPRMAALAEVQWLNPEQKDFSGFMPRLFRFVKLYDRIGYNYAHHIEDVQTTFVPVPEEGNLKTELTAPGNDYRIVYTVDGNEPSSGSTTYEAPLKLVPGTILKARVIREGQPGRVFTEQINEGLSVLHPVSLLTKPSGRYAFNGGPELTDGLFGNTNYKTGRWLGFIGNDLEAVIDLGTSRKISEVTFHSLVMKRDGIWDAAGISVHISDDGKTFREITAAAIPSEGNAGADGIKTHTTGFAQVDARYVKVFIRSARVPEGTKNAGQSAFLFVDEIIIK